MASAEAHFVEKWEVSLAELENTVGKLFKVARRLPAMAVAETRMFRSKEEAMRQFKEWLR